MLDAAGVKADDSRVKALVAALSGVDIEEAIKTAAPVASAAPAPGQPAADAPAAEKKAEPEEDKVSEEEAAAGLGALFG